MDKNSLWLSQDVLCSAIATASWTFLNTRLTHNCIITAKNRIRRESIGSLNVIFDTADQSYAVDVVACSEEMNQLIGN